MKALTRHLRALFGRGDRQAGPRRPGGTTTAPWTPPPRDGKIRLNLGCGDKILDGYLNADFAASRKSVSPDVMMDLRRPAFAERVADEILCVHVIEHFYVWEAEAMLKSWRGILKPGGRIVLECPNLLSAARALLEDPVRGARLDRSGKDTMWPLYGDPRWRDPLMCHKWGYTPHSLKELLRRCGYRKLAQEPAQFKKREPRDMRITGENPK